MPAGAIAETLTARATLEDLYRVEGKTELVDGKIIFMGSGILPSRVAYRVTRRLDDHVASVSLGGEVFPDGIVYAQRPPLLNGRESFQPDSSYYVGSYPANRMRFIDGAPVFAVEVRFEHDYGLAAERDMALKRADYFEAGTLVVWDVDPVADKVSVYRQDTPERPTVYRTGETAEAEPAVPGWRVAVSDLFA